MKNLRKVCLVVFSLCLFGGSINALANYQNNSDQKVKVESQTEKKQNSGQNGAKKKNERINQSTESSKTTAGKTSQSPQNNLDDERNLSEQSSEKPIVQSDKTAPVPQTTSDRTPATEGWFDNIWASLSWLLLGLAGLAAVALVGWFVYYVFTNIWREREASANGFNAVKLEQREIKSQIKQLNETVKLQNDRIERQQSLIQSLQKQSSAASNIAYAAQSPQVYEQPQVYKPEPQFPVSAEDYLNKIGNNAQKASADLIAGLLVQDPNKNQEFLIVKDNSLMDGLYYAVPSFHRFSTKHDYMTYYQNYYTCESPSGGTVWILSPTTVRRVEGGWKLVDMGELEIR